jgi:hypothetical protein
MPRFLRALPRVAAVVAVLAASIVVPMPRPAGALPQPDLTIGPDEHIAVRYDGIPANNPANEAQDPDTCQAAPYCYAIHLHLNRPANLSADDEFTLRFTMSWPVDASLTGVPVEDQATSNDVDLSIWAYPYTSKDAEGNTTEATNTGAATTKDPERTAMNTPKDNDFWLVITNFVGVNKEINLDISWDPEVFEAPHEDLGPTGGPRDLSEDTGAVLPSATYPTSGFATGSADRTAFVTPDGSVSSLTTPTVPAAGAIVVGDDGFHSTAADAGLSGGLLEAARRLTARPAARLSKAGPVAPALLIFWLLVVPLALVGTTVVVMLRRRPAALAF